MKEYVGFSADKTVAVVDPGTPGWCLPYRLSPGAGHTPMDLSGWSPLQSETKDMLSYSKAAYMYS